MHGYTARRAVRVFSLLLLAASLFAQVSTSRLEGTVADETGAMVPAASVTATNVRTQVTIKTTSNEQGFFIFPSLQPGLYSLAVESAGFRKAVVANIELNVSATVTQHVKLEVGSVTESVTIESNAVRVQTADAQIGRQITLQDISVMPMLSRSPIQLAVFQPGVSINPGDATFSRVNGLRQGSNNAKLDGIDVNDSVVPRIGLSLTANNTDSVEEFRVVLNGGKAEYGRNAGAQIEMITRSGSNEFHGNAYDYLRNNVLHANNFFNNASRVARPKYIQNQFGASFGGRVIRDKTFFFGNYQGSRVSQQVVRNRTVLTPEAKRGLFRWTSPGSTAVQSFDIVANDPLRRGIDSAVKKNLDLLPDPNNFDIGDGLNTAGFRFNNPAGNSNDQFTFKVDHNLSSSHRIFYRHSWFKTFSIDALNNADAPFPGQPHGTQGGVRWGYSIGSDWSITPTVVNEARFGRQSASVAFNRPARIKGPGFLSNLFTDPISNAFPQGRNSPVWDFTDNVTHIRGKHTWKAGATYRSTLQHGYNDAGAYPNVTFARANGNLPAATVGPNGAGVISSADRQRFENLYNDVLGRMDRVVVTYYSDLEKWQPTGTGRIRNTVLREYGLFLQDDWKVTRNLTLNVGMRWELFSPPSERNGLQGKLDRPELINTVTNVADLRVQRTNSWFDSDKNNFAPRIGLAWDPKGNGDFAIRGGYGIYYDRMIGATLSYVDGNTPGFSQVSDVFPNGSGVDTRAAAGVPIPRQPAAPVLQQAVTRTTTIGTFKPNLATGYVHHFNFNIQKEVMRNAVLDIGYVGTRGVKLFTWLDMNQPRVYGDLLGAFREMQAFRANGAAPSPGNTLVRLFGTPAAVVSAIGAGTFDNGLLGAAADTVDRTNHTRYNAAGLSHFYLRNFPQYNQVVLGTNDGQSYYHSFQTSFRRTTTDLKFVVNYTFSKSMDNISVDGNGFSAPIDNYNFALNRARGDYDRPHVMNGMIAYTLPIGQGKRLGGDLPGWADSLIGGWDIGLLTVWQSGSLFTASSGRRTGPSTANTWANYSGERNIGSLDKSTGAVLWFNNDQKGAFSFPGPGEIGTSGRNAFRGPAFRNFDISLVKQFKLPMEGHAINFRWEFYNALNQPMFANPAANLATPQTFGRISATTANNPRIMQLALRYDF